MPNTSIAHIVIDGQVFQVLNADETDWNEPETAILVQEYINDL